MLQVIDRSNPVKKAKLYLSKPNKDIISPLNDAYNIVYSPKLGGISELSFSIPVQVESHHKLIINPNLNKLKGFYLIKYVGNTTEWFIINQPTKSMSESGDVKNIHCFSIPFELSFKNIRSLEAISYNLQRIVEDILQNDTIWSLGFCDPSFNLIYRSFKVNNKSILDFLNEIAVAFNSLMIYDTELRTVSFYKQEDVGTNKGFRLSYGNLMKGVEEVVDNSLMATRFRPTGLDGLSINSVNPMGSNYIEDFSYFIAGFVQDANGNVLAESPYMSNELCKALIAYDILIDSKKGVYSAYLVQLQTTQELLVTKQNELADLQIAMDQITDNLDIAQCSVDADSVAQAVILVAQQKAQQILMDTKNSEIATTNVSIASINAQITALQTLLNAENNFTLAEIRERTQFILEKDWQNDNYWDAQELYDAGVLEFDKIRVPQISVKIDMVNFLDILEEQKRWDKLNLGDIITVYYDKLDIYIQAKITEFSINHEDGSISLTVANVQEIITDEIKFINDLYKSISTSNVVQVNSNTWNSVDQVAFELSDFLKNSLKTANQTIVSGNNESVVVNRRGITVFDPSSPMHLIRINHGSILLSEDGGETVSLAINSAGLYAETIIGKLLIGEKLIIETANGIIRINGQSITVFEGDKTTKRVILGDISDLEDGSLYGLKLINNNGVTVISNGIVNSDSIQLVDNVDENHKLKLKIYVPNEVLEVRSVKLAFSLEMFRAYEQGIASGGGTTISSEGGGASSPTSEGGGGTGGSANGDHSHLMFHIEPLIIPEITPNDKLLRCADGNSALSCKGEISTSGDLYTKGTSGNHTHNGPTHSHQTIISPHNHSVILPLHNHSLQFGIFESTMASAVDVYVDGILRLNNGGLHYNSDQNNLELSPYIQTSGWHVIELSSASLGRVNASLYILSYIAL
ncbi:MAG TPA: phage tail protein [Clostridium sp.]|uniref:phage tail protein n=1 Tax=Clostridium sp. TaxID=1506 RepID=UPI002F94446E